MGSREAVWLIIAVVIVLILLRVFAVI